MYREKIEEWKRKSNLDEKLRREIENYDEKEAEDAFYKDLEFGTGGLRAIMGAGTNRLNIYTIRKNTEGYARWISKQSISAKKQGIVIAYDNRNMSREFAIETAKVLIKHKIKTYFFTSLRPTPELSYAIRYLNAFGGIVITASHNSKEYNGYKIYDETGCQCVLRYTNEISKEINDVKNPLDIDVLSEIEVKNKVIYIDKKIDEAYYDDILKIQIHPELNKDNTKIVYSPLHGTGNIPVREVLKRAGYTVIPVKKQCNPDPDFANTKNPNPECFEAFEESLKVAKQFNADCILCTDPDCDRLGVMVKNRNKYQLLTGNQIGAIFLNYILEERSKLKTLPQNSVVFSSIVTSSLGDMICKKYNIKTEKTLTGFKFIGDRIQNIEKDGKEIFLFGYEESNGYLFSDVVRDKDGIQSCLIMSEIVNFYKLQDKTLIDVLNEIYGEFGFYYDSQKSISFSGKDGDEKISKLMDGFRKKGLTRLCDLEIKSKQDYQSGKIFEGKKIENINLPKSNVLKFVFSDDSWLALRPSGTEPKIKCYIFSKDDKFEDKFEDLINILE